MNAYHPLESREHRLPAKRSGPLEGLPSGHTREAQWLDDDQDGVARYAKPALEVVASTPRWLSLTLIRSADPVPFIAYRAARSGKVCSRQTRSLSWRLNMISAPEAHRKASS